MEKDGKERHDANWLDSSTQIPEKMLALVANNGSASMPHDDKYATCEEKFELFQCKLSLLLTSGLGIVLFEQRSKDFFEVLATSVLVFHPFMGHNKLVMKKIEDLTSRQQIYSKRKDSIVKKAYELAILCDTDVALLMFSPNSQVTNYSSKGSVEDIMLWVVNQPGELNRRLGPNEQNLTQSLTQSKYKGEMVEKIAIVRAHEEKLNKLNQRLNEAREKIRYYEPQVENIKSVQEAFACQQFLMSAMEQIQLSKEKFLGGEGFLQRNENIEVASVNTEDTGAADNGSAYSNA